MGCSLFRDYEARREGLKGKIIVDEADKYPDKEDIGALGKPQTIKWRETCERSGVGQNQLPDLFCTFFRLLFRAGSLCMVCRGLLFLAAGKFQLPATGLHLAAVCVLWALEEVEAEEKLRLERF